MAVGTQLVFAKMTRSFTPCREYALQLTIFPDGKLFVKNNVNKNQLMNFR